MAEHPIANEAYSTTIPNLADMEKYVGKELGLSEWIPITQERINTFADATDDHQWIHVDPELASQHSPYQTTIAHGFLILAMASRVCYDTYQIEDVAMGVNYGLEKVRFPTATPAGSKVRGRVSLTDFRKLRYGAKLLLKVVFELEGQAKPACIAEFIGLCYSESETAKRKSITSSTPSILSRQKNQ